MCRSHVILPTMVVVPASSPPTLSAAMPQPLEVCMEAAKAGGQVLLDWQHRFVVREKAARDLVTEADVSAQEAIREIIHKAFPEHDFLSEEEACDRVGRGLEAIPQRRSDFRWIVDPLDGTTNYVHHLPGFAVSIALQQGSEVVIGAVYDPIADELFVGQRGRGATLNGRPIRTSGCQRLGEALIAVSFPPHVSRESLEIQRFVEILLASQSVRRMGSAALNLSYVAAGRLDGYVATSVNIWDVAAGLLLVREAGGSESGIDGDALCLERPELIVAASQPLHEQLMKVANVVGDSAPMGDFSVPW
jgi:myo-inositol-1(or 4)-monophosphatase